ncbi:oligosaccharide flippase family protein [Candidatus Acetothermia bacterium]|nr:oligosaccharide flippase family protein [Candidatus Acetothermia bacterium]MBI3643990.1 oligosaccharide flippase family protein [Candidatus Acetothermia bacterium]
MIHLLKRFLPQDRFARNAIILAGGTGLGQSVVLLFSPLLTRLYTPTDFGLFSVYLSVLTMLIAIVSLKYELAIPLPTENKTALNLVALSLMIVVIISLLVLLIVELFGVRLDQLINTENISLNLWILPWSLLFAGINQAVSYWAIRNQRFGIIAQSRVNQGLGQVVAQASLGFLWHSPIGLFIGDLFSRISSTAGLVIPSWKQDRKALSDEVTAESMREAGRKYKRFPLFSSWSGLLNIGGIQLPPILLISLYDPHSAGLFALVQRVMGAPVTLISGSVSQVYIGEASQALQSEDPSLIHLFKMTTRRLFKISALLLLAGLICPWVFPILFGPDWSQAGCMAAIMAPTLALQMIVSSISPSANLVGRQDIQLYGDAIRLILVVLSLYGAHALGSSPTEAVAFYSLGMVLTYIAFFFGYRYVVYSFSVEEVR